MKRLPAEIVRRGEECFLEKTCSDHGQFSTVVWRGDNPSFEAWGGAAAPVEPDQAKPDCPNACGLCPSHRQKSCCVIVEATSRCNLECPFCFAQSRDGAADPTIEELSESFMRLAEQGNSFVQISGGEPTLRDDLPEVVARARAAGCEHIQLNTNGIRLGEDRGYAKALAQAGLSFVFMQFDGVDDAIYRQLRRRPLLAHKHAAIDACSSEFLGVTLVPTIVRGVNDQHIGAILDFAVANSPAVRGVHLQPVSYFGRTPATPRNEERITLPEVLRAIETQTAGRFTTADFAPSGCDHPRCGFHGDFVALPGSIIRLTSRERVCCSQVEDAHLKNRRFVARRWTRTAAAGEHAGCDSDCRDMDGLLARIRSHGFTITAMAFQDAYTIDLERLRRCSLHVHRGERTIPFCAAYITPAMALPRRERSSGPSNM